jgi:hypothetical protein
MLSVNETVTKKMLTELVSSNFINDLTALVVIDFVIYNAFAEYFAYVAIVFEFHHSGKVNHSLKVFGVRMDMYKDAYTIASLIMEIVLLLINLYYLAMTFRDVFQAVKSQRKEVKEEAKPTDETKANCLQKLFRGIQTIGIHCFKNPFIVIDFVSCGMTIATFGCWYTYLFGLHFRDKYFFPEEPMNIVGTDEWPRVRCEAAGWTCEDNDLGIETMCSEWCSDSDVIHNFSIIAYLLKNFKLVLGVNTVIVFFRALKYLLVFTRVRVISNTFYRGLVDILWFIVVSSTILSGYVFAGRQLFGQANADMSNFGSAFRYAFEMFLGHFDYGALQSKFPIIGNIFFFSYMILFKFFVINMFLAIICKNFNEEENYREKAVKKARADRNPSNTQAPEQKIGFFARCWPISLFSRQALNSPKMGDSDGGPVPSDYKGQEGQEVQDNEGQENGEDEQGNGQRPSVRKASKQSEHADEDGIEAKMKQQIDENSGWHLLPEEIQQWSLQKAREMSDFVNDNAKKREDVKRQKLEATDLDRCLEEAETDLKDRIKGSRQSSQESRQSLELHELTKLREVHQDQESLSWYVMKREAELRKSEQTVEVKQSNYDKMMNVAKTLIRPDDEDDFGRDAGNELALGPDSSSPLALGDTGVSPRLS